MTAALVTNDLPVGQEIEVALVPGNEFSRLRVELVTPGGVVIPLPVADGGTGLVTLLAHALLVGNGTLPVGQIAPGTVGFVLTSNGPTLDPSYQPGTPGPAGPAGTGTSIAATTMITTSGLIPNFGATPNIIRETIDVSTGSQILRTLPAPGGVTAPNGSVYWLKLINSHTTANLFPVLVQGSGGAPLDDPNDPAQTISPSFDPVACAFVGGNYVWQLNTARAWELIMFPQVPGMGI